MFECLIIFISYTLDLMKIIFAIAIICILTECNSTNELSAQINQTNFKEFKTSKELVFLGFIKPPFDKVGKLMIRDSSLIIKNGDKNTKYLFYQYLLQNKKLVDSQIVSGSDHGQMLSPFSVGTNSNFWWAHDATTKKIITISGRSNLDDFQLKNMYYNVGISDSLKMYANGNYLSSAKIEVVDLKTGKILDSIGSFNDAPSNVAKNSWKMALQSFLFLKPSGDKLILANRYTDKIEIFNLKNKSSKIFAGPENFEPEFNAYTANGLDLIERNEKTRFAFTNGYVTDNYIYLVFSGEKESVEYAGYGKFIYIYDWEGNPIQKVSVSFNVGSLAVDQDKDLYVFDIEDKSIKKANFNFK